MILGTACPQYMWAVFMVITIFWPEASLRRRKPVWYSHWLTFWWNSRGKFQSSCIRRRVPPSVLEVGLGLEGGLPAGQRCLACLLGLLLQLGVQPLDQTLGQSQLRQSTQVPSSGPLGTGFVCALGRSAVKVLQWHPTPVLLPGKSHGWRSLVGCSPWGREESGKTEQLHFHFSLSCIGEGNGNPLQCSCLENPRDRGAW